MFGSSARGPELAIVGHLQGIVIADLPVVASASPACVASIGSELHIASAQDRALSLGKLVLHVPEAATAEVDLDVLLSSLGREGCAKQWQGCC